MIYGLYLSAAGVMSNSYRQDVIANNLANSETIGFKRDLAVFRERPTALRERGQGGDYSDPILENLGGGILASRSLLDNHQGDLEHTGNPLDVAIVGNGYFSVTNGRQQTLTRDGRFMLNRNGELILSNDRGQRVLDPKGKPIHLDPNAPVAITSDGQITQNGNAVGAIGLFDVANPALLKKQGGTMLAYPDGTPLQAATGSLAIESQEKSNVDPTTELAELMTTQRNLEANANMIKYQDSMLAQLVSSVGKIT
ncbi:MAG TPA: flagellar hook-basal body protein [Tepidisphaeraceae bacterium]|nr:flagellar hook-basal body protein [Tepidisphaeraceae bacterium]